MKLDTKTSDSIDEVIASNDDQFDRLVEISGLNKGADFRGIDLRSVDFRKSDLSNFDFSYSDLRGCIWDQVSLGSLKKYERSLRGLAKAEAVGLDIDDLFDRLTDEKKWKHRARTVFQGIGQFGVTPEVLRSVQDKEMSDRSQNFGIICFVFFVSEFLGDDVIKNRALSVVAQNNSSLRKPVKVDFLLYLFSSYTWLANYHPRMRFPGEINATVLAGRLLDFLERSHGKQYVVGSTDLVFDEDSFEFVLA